MKRVICYMLALCLLVTVTACSSRSGSSDTGNTESDREESGILESETVSPTVAEREPEESLTEESKAEEPSAEDIMDAANGESTNILIAYFTWAENTHVDDPGSVDVDATTSASVLMPGNVGLMAQWIREETGGDTFSIITENAYSSDYDTCLNRAIEEHDNGVRPAITGHVDNMEDYDIIFLGFPNWWYSCPMAILTFIEEHDLSGKTIIPFCSHGTGGFAASLRDIGNELPEDCIVLEEFGAYRPEVADSQDELLTWLSGLDIEY